MKVEDIFEQISRFVNLKTLSLTVEEDNFLNVNMSTIHLISKCQKLIDLSIVLRSGSVSSKTGFLQLIKEFVFLKRLDVRIKTQGISLGSLESLKQMSRLQELKILSAEISDKHLVDIDKNCPKLKSIELKTMENISDKSLQSLSKLKYLEKIKLFGIPFQLLNITDSGVCKLITDCSNIKIIDFICGIKISNTSIQRLKSLANSRPAMRFSFCWKRTEQQDQELSGDLRGNHTSADRFMSELNNLPKNLFIYSREYFTGWCGTGRLMEIQGYKRQFEYEKSNSCDESEQFSRLRSGWSVARFHTYKH